MHAIMRYIWHMYLCARTCVCVFQSSKWPGWAQMGTWQIWHSLSQSNMETPSSCQPALSNSMAGTVDNKSQRLFFFPFRSTCSPSNQHHSPPLTPPLVFCITGNACFLLYRICCYRWDQDGLCTVQEPGLLPVHRERKRETKQWGHLP